MLLCVEILLDLAKSVLRSTGDMCLACTSLGEKKPEGGVLDMKVQMLFANN